MLNVNALYRAANPFSKHSLFNAYPGVKSLSFNFNRVYSLLYFLKCPSLELKMCIEMNFIQQIMSEMR